MDFHDDPFVRGIRVDRRDFFSSDWAKCFRLPPKNVARTIFLVQSIPNLPGIVDTNLIHPDDLTVIKPRRQIDRGNILKPGCPRWRIIQDQVHIGNRHLCPHALFQAGCRQARDWRVGLISDRLKITAPDVAIGGFHKPLVCPSGH